MDYWLTVFNEATWNQFLDMSSKVCAYNDPSFGRLPTFAIDDIILCYISKRMAWAGMVRVSGERYRDLNPIYAGGIFPNRVPVESLVILDLEKAVPMPTLEGLVSFFPKGKTNKAWAPYFQKSPKRLFEDDATAIMEKIRTAHASS